MSIMEPKNASMYFFGKLLDKYSTSFYWFSLSQKKSNFNKWKVPYESSGPIKISILNSKLLKYINFYPWAVLRGLKAAIFGKKNNVDLVLADIAFESILVSRVASNILNIPLISSIHDDPVNRLKKKNYSPSFVELYERVFHKTLKKSKRCIVISDYMGKYYSKKYNIKFKTLFLGPDENKLLPIKNIKNDNKPFVFGSVGSINHASNFETFLESCMQKNNLKNYPLLRVNVIGNNDIQISESFQEIASLKGWINNQSFQEELKIINAGFLTSTFKQSEKVQSITSFPLKIHSFIQAGVPIFSTFPSTIRQETCGTPSG